MRRRLKQHSRPSEKSEATIRELRAGSQSGDGYLSSLCQRMVHQGIHRSVFVAAQCAWACASSERGARRKCRQQLSYPVANVGLLFFSLVTTPPSNRAKAHACAKERKSFKTIRNSWRAAMTAKPLAIDSPALSESLALSEAERVKRVDYLYLTWFLAITSFCVISCATISRHKFSEPTANWQTRSGQLMYRTATTTLIGDVLVRFSKTGDFELTLSKGPGVVLLSLRQDAGFAEVKGPFARGGWSGPVEHAPQQLLGLRDKLIHSQDRQSVRYVANNETFLFRF